MCIATGRGLLGKQDMLILLPISIFTTRHADFLLMKSKYCTHFVSFGDPETERVIEIFPREEPLILLSKCHGCWWHGGIRSQGISIIIYFCYHRIFWFRHQKMWVKSFRSSYYSPPLCKPGSHNPVDSTINIDGFTTYSLASHSKQIR